MSFHCDHTRYDGLFPWCRTCCNGRPIYQDEAAKARYAAQRQLRRHYLKAAVLAWYSDTDVPSCRCCGATSNLFLDHKYGDGAEHRAMLGDPSYGGWRIYVFLIELNFPAGYQVLCRNCNTSKGTGPACHIHHHTKAAA
jgi:hypothetical protein